MRSLLSLYVLFFIFSLSTHTALAQVTAPSQGGEVGLVSVTSTTLEIAFGNSGNGQGRVVAIAPAPGWKSVPLGAVDGTFYSGNTEYGRGSALGQGYTVYNGPNHSVIITGLQPGTVYYISDSEYNTDGTTILYNTRSSNLILSTAATPRPAAITSTPLPVSLTAFTGEVNARGFATLHWTTASEQNTLDFSIERSSDGQAFAETGRVAAGGNSNLPLVYSWNDPQLLLTSAYYRLRQVDRDGTTRYSPVLALAPHIERSIEVYPSPSSGQTVQLLVRGFEHEILTLSLADMVGKQVTTQTMLPNSNLYQTQLPTGLAAGTYFLTLSSKSNFVKQRFIISE